MATKFEVIDAFTTKPFSGNPAAVVLLDKFPPDERLQLIAREFNYAATAFVVRSGKDYSLRWFSPLVELEICGHGTLASAHYLFRNKFVDEKDAITFNTKNGKLVCTKKGPKILMEFGQEPPAPTPTPIGLLEALKLRSKPLYVGKNRIDLVVQVADEADLTQIQPDFEALTKIPTRCIIVTAKASSASIDFVSRVFCPSIGVKEDAVTGSAHCALAVYWSQILKKQEGLKAIQLSERGGEIEMDLKDNIVVLKGSAVTISTGALVA